MRSEHQVSGVLDLHETPMVGLSEHVEHRTALLGEAIEDAMQRVGREAIGTGLRALPVVDAQEGMSSVCAAPAAAAIRSPICSSPSVILCCATPVSRRANKVASTVSAAAICMPRASPEWRSASRAA